MLSDGAIASIVTGVVTIAVAIIGFLSQRKKTGEMGEKIDANTVVTEETKQVTVVAAEAAGVAAKAAGEAASKTDKHSDLCMEEIARLKIVYTDHHGRIAALEVQNEAIKSSVDMVAKNLDSTRHEMRGHLQTLMNKLDILSAKKDS